MCKFNPKNEGRRIDPCMRNFIKILNRELNNNWVIKACCCGHRKYNMTIVLMREELAWHFDLVSGKYIPREKRFYRRDKQGYYYIPEVSNEKDN